MFSVLQREPQVLQGRRRRGAGTAPEVMPGGHGGAPEDANSISETKTKD